MKRTALFFAIAAAVGLLALVVALVPQATTRSTVTPPPVVTPPTGPATPPGPQLAGDVLKLSAALSDPYLVLGGEREAFLKIDLDAARLATSERAAVNIAIVLDRSGSMAGEKIEQCRRAARHLVQQLDSRDRFALVSFGSDVTQIISSTLATPAAKQQMLAAIDGINEAGGTNISGGLEAGLAEVIAYRSQYNVSRLVLLSDGQANEGISDPRGLAAIARRIAGQDVTLSSIGVGLDFNELVLESLAEQGGGGYHFLAESEQLQRIFALELQQAVATVALKPVLALTPRPGVVITDIYGYLAETNAGVTRIQLPDFSGGQHRKVVVRLLVPARAEGLVDVAAVGLTYLDVTRDRAPGAAQVSVSASVTSDSTLAAQKRDNEVGATAAHAQAVQALRQAGISYSQGRGDEAAQLLGSARNRLRQAETDFGASKDLDDALGEAEVFEKSLAAPTGSAERSKAAKRLHSFSNTAR